MINYKTSIFYFFCDALKTNIFLLKNRIQMSEDRFISRGREFCNIYCIIMKINTIFCNLKVKCVILLSNF